MADEALSTLLNMGFGYEESSMALEKSKQDVSEAVALLTDPSRPISGPFLPDNSVQPMEIEAEEPGEEFPAKALKDLQGRVFCENWSISYREGEALHKCLTAAMRLAQIDTCEEDKDCNKFISDVLPECFRKLLTSNPVHDWNSEIQEGVYDITSQFVEFAVIRLQHKLDITVLKTLAIIMDPRSEFNFRNRSRRSKPANNQNNESTTEYALCPPRTTFRDPYGWLVAMINTFGAAGGFKAIKKLILADPITDTPDPFKLSFALKPWANCVEYLNHESLKGPFGLLLERSIVAIHKMGVEDLKHKEAGLVCDLLLTMKTICSYMFEENDAINCDEMRMVEIEKMLKTSHFNSRMNALNETLRLVDETRDLNMKYPIDRKQVLNWLVDKRILMTALENNLHQVQYTAKLKRIAEFLGSSITIDEVSQFWKMQEGRQPVVVDNTHNILAAAAVQFNEGQANHLFNLITASWVKETSKARQRLLLLLSKLGKLSRTIEHVWALVHLPDVRVEEVEQGLLLHLDLANQAYNNEDVKREYVMKCITDIKAGNWVVPALRHLVKLLQSMLLHSTSKQGKNILKELQNSVHTVKLVATSLVQSYRSATRDLKEETVAPDHLHFGVYTLTDCVDAHLKMLKLALDNCSDYLPWGQVEAIWDCLTSPIAASSHHDVCCEWFAAIISDLEHSTQTKFYEQRLLLMSPQAVHHTTLKCFKAFFESINAKEGKLKRMGGDNFTVESTKLIGLNYIWDVALEASDDNVAREAMQYLLRVSFTALAPKLKRDYSALHSTFTKHCQILLQQCKEDYQNNTGKTSERRTASIINITTDYIVLAESFHRGVRFLEPHGATFLGPLITFYLAIDKEIHKVHLHANVKVACVRQQAAKLAKASSESVQLQLADETLAVSKDNTLLHASSIIENCTVNIKVLPSSSSPIKAYSDEANTLVKFERQLPGVLLTQDPEVHDGLYILSSMGPAVEIAVRRLLVHLPTDPRLQEKLEVIELNQSSNIAHVLDYICNADTLKLIYNLEALSARVMPVRQDSTDKQTQQNLAQHITSDNGLNFFYNILAVDKDSIDTKHPCGAVAVTEDSMFEVVKLVISIFRGLLCGASAPLYRHSVPLNVTHLRKLSNEQLKTLMQFFSHIALCCASGSQLKSWGRALPNHACAQTMSVAPQYAQLGCEAIELVMLGAVHHDAGIQVLFEVMELAGCKRILLELLLTTPSKEIRELVLSELKKLCDAQAPALEPVCDPQSPPCGAQGPPIVEGDVIMDTDGTPAPVDVRHKLLFMLLKTPLPVWGSSLHGRDKQQRLLTRCSQFFNLLSYLLQEMSLSSMSCRELGVAELVKEEINLLKTIATFTITITEWSTQNSSHTLSKLTDGKLSHSFVAGHLRLLCALCSIQGVEKRQVGKKLIPSLLSDFLFPAANLIHKTAGSKTRSQDLVTVPLCYNDEETQAAAYSLLVTLVTGCSENGRDVTLELVRLHHPPAQDLSTEWDYIPMVQPRTDCGYVGLKNGGATCYMNAVLQQLHAIPGLSSSMLAQQPISPCSVSPTRSPSRSPKNSGSPKESGYEDMFVQLQHVLGHLTDSRMKYYNPKGLWGTFKLWGQPINIHEQQDAFEFFNNLTDQIDEVLKERGKSSVCHEQFGGQFVDQKICEECPHRSELIEPFMSLSVSTRTGNLEDSLEQFVRGEVLEGENAYLCEECDEKRTTLKRLCIKTLPNTLIIHLKRFDYDWERNKAFKFDDYFSFPWQLDMLPYTQIGVEGTPRQKRDVASLYSLSGVVVHSGQANAGHYYSFIKKQGTNTWFKFNDDNVTSIQLDDQTLIEECFGGEFKGKGNYQQTRSRYWNAYILFYDKVQEMSPPSPWKKPLSPTKRIKPSRLSMSKLPDIADNEAPDPVQTLEALIKSGEKAGMFSERLPPGVRDAITQSNTQLVKERAVFNEAYFTFLRDLVGANTTMTSDFCTWSTKLLSNFFLHTYLHLNKRFQFNESSWLQTFQHVMSSDITGPTTFLDFICNTRNHDYLTLHLLICPNSHVRSIFSDIINIALDALFNLQGSTSQSDAFLTRYLTLLASRELSDNYKNADKYFSVLHNYSKISSKTVDHLRGAGYVPQLLNFLIGFPPGNDAPPKWAQLNSFSAGYQALCQILLHTSFTSYQSTECSKPNPVYKGDVEALEPHTQCPGIAYLMGEGTTITLVHLIQASHVTLVPISNILCHMSWCNQAVSTCIINLLLSQLSTIPDHQLKPLFTILVTLLGLEDPYQLMRVEHIVAGEYSGGLLNLVKSCSGNEPKRAYQCIKFLTQLLRTNAAAKEHINEHVTAWQWSVNWLKNVFDMQASLSTNSNESASSKGFQRTSSAQETLSDATALLNEFEASQ